MAERYNENMEKSKEYRTWLEAKQTCTKVPREVSLVSNLLRWLCFRLFFLSLEACQAAMKDFHTCPRQGPIVGMTEDTMNAYRQICSKSWLEFVGLLDGMMSEKLWKWPRSRIRKRDWNLIGSAGGESKAMRYDEVCLILRVCCCTTVPVN